MERILFYIPLTNFFNENQGMIIFLQLLVTLITAGIFLGIFFLTKNYTKSTNDLVQETGKTLNLTVEREKIDRTLDFISKFNYKKFGDLRRIKANEKDKDCRKNPDFLSNLYFFLDYFDTIALLNKKERIDEQLFESKIESWVVNFAFFFKNEIYEEIKELKEGKGYYWYEYFVELADKVLNKEKYKNGKFFIALYLLTNEYGELLKQK